MKNLIACIAALLCLTAKAQFPAPSNFIYEMDYIELGEDGWCDGVAVNGPSHCSSFTWNMPDTSNTNATLNNFEIYNITDGVTTLIHSLTDTNYTVGEAYADTLYVIAIYSNPEGQSEPSNFEFSEGIPVGIDNVSLQESSYKLRFNQTSKTLETISDTPLKQIDIYNLDGKLVYSDKGKMRTINLNNLSSGLYIFFAKDEDNRIYNRKLLIQ